ncbi:uncharacterized protein T551_03551 [Pneumocystis jirovecii RU7]|uniref:Nucleolar protein 16 n=1 Tax=Pneumocystis jirovecii (strain RU7) TaxID=1408657 RepID=A0A0W4ZCZ8_PNEJ7|nr:uncharacterized protein T551_03551 [Pneumocystis jirovecii RU7]KTW26252.1 hypothetical protein T551_03551 [Pneumocystis jirovecii RU7]
MTNPRQRKKQRRVTIKKKKRISKKHQPLSINFGPILSESWDKKKTLKENYAHLGLIAKPNNEKCIFGKKYSTKTSLLNKNDNSKLQPNEAQIQRDNEGNVIEIIYGKQRKFDDTSDSDITTEEMAPKTEVIRELKEKAEKSTKVDRKLSKNETIFLEKLIDRYGDDIDAMTKDIKLNAMQQTAGDLRRKIKKLNKEKKQS